MEKSLSWFLQKELLVRDKTSVSLSPNYLRKARTNLVTMNLLSKAQRFREALEFPEDYTADEWIVITAYYAMYMAALSVLARLGYRSKNHSATIRALYELLVGRKLLEQEFVETLNRLRIRHDEVQELERARYNRETAQYSVTKQTAKDTATQAQAEAYRFVDRMEELLRQLPEKM